jgi:hypothetical protein
VGDTELPIFIIVGAARSGTTYLASLITGDDVCYVEEPNIIWMYRNASSKDDCLTTDHASEKVIRYIRTQFSRKLRKSGAKTLLEKTPSNCLRLPFVRAVFPEAKFIFVERDIEDVAKSAYKKWTKEEDANTEKLYGGGHKRRQFVLMFKRFLSVSLLDVVYYVPKIYQELSFFVIGRRRVQWGPRYFGMREDLKRLAIEELCFKQAQECQEAAAAFRSSLSKNDYIVVRYDEMKRASNEVTNKVRVFMGAV